MATLVCNVKDILGSPVSGIISIQTGEVRPGYVSNDVLVNKPRETLLSQGSARFTGVSPGDAVVKIQYGGFTETLRITVPNVAEVLLSECLEAVELPPAELESVKQVAREAVRELNAKLAEANGLSDEIRKAQAVLDRVLESERGALSYAEMSQFSASDAQGAASGLRELLSEAERKIGEQRTAVEQVLASVSALYQLTKELVDSMPSNSGPAGPGGHVIVGSGVYPSNADLEPLKQQVDDLQPLVGLVTKVQNDVSYLKRVRDMDKADFNQLVNRVIVCERRINDLDSRVSALEGGA